MEDEREIDRQEHLEGWVYHYQSRRCFHAMLSNKKQSEISRQGSTEEEEGTCRYVCLLNSHGGKVLTPLQN